MTVVKLNLEGTDFDGMEMPEYCNVCPFHAAEDVLDYGEWLGEVYRYCRWTLTDIGISDVAGADETKLENCPLISIEQV